MPLPRGARASIVEHSGAAHLVLSFDAAPLPALPAALTDAERSVAHLLLAGLSNEEIATARACSTNTVAKQVSSVYRKLGVQSRAELAARSRRRP